MKGLLTPILLGAAFCVVIAVVPAIAVEGVIIDWGPLGYGVETDYNPELRISNPGSELTVRALIDRFFDPFLDLEADVLNEYTIVLEGLVSLGSQDYGTIIVTDYGSGTFSIFQDPAMNYDFADPGTFTDGTLILSGPITGFVVTNINVGGGVWAGSYLSDFEFTGPLSGPLYSRVEACYGANNGGWTTSGPMPDGYTCIVDGHFSVEDCRGTSTEETQWGSIKRLFR